MSTATYFSTTNSHHRVVQKKKNCWLWVRHFSVSQKRICALEIQVGNIIQYHSRSF